MLNTLIDNALAITGKTMYDMHDEIDSDNERSAHIMFRYYLLSPEFIEKYTNDFTNVDRLYISSKFGEAIYEYQLGNEEPLTILLSKI